MRRGALATCGAVASLLAVTSPAFAASKNVERVKTLPEGKWATAINFLNYGKQHGDVMLVTGRFGLKSYSLKDPASPKHLRKDYNIILDNVHFTLRATRKDVSDLVGGNFDFRWTATDLKNAVFKRDIPGIYARYIDGLHIQNSSIAWGKPAANFFSSGVELEDFKNLDVSEFRGSNAPGAKAATFLLRNGTGVVIRDSTASVGTDVFVDAQRISGKRLLMNNDFANAATALKDDAVQFTQRGNYIGGNTRPVRRDSDPR